MAFFVSICWKAIVLNKEEIIKKVKILVNEYKYKLILGLMALVFLLGGLMIYNKSSMPQDNTTKPNLTTKTNSNHFSHHSEQMFVDVEGAVKKPGVYQFTTNMRVADAVNLAGGLNHSADRQHVSFAKKLADQQTIYVPVKGEVKSHPSEDNNSEQEGHSSESKKINLNTANSQKLQSIDGIGAKRAQKIIDYRKAHGKFHNINDLKKINGIGDKFVANIKDKVTI